jgi:uncharacterized protein YggE
VIHGLRFDVQQREQAEASALQSAVKNAMAKAQAIALGSNRAIEVAILKIEELSGRERT